MKRRIVILIMAFWAAVLAPTIAELVISLIWAFRLHLPLSDSIEPAAHVALLFSVGTAIQVLLLIIPAFLILERLRWLRWWSMTGVGFIFACLSAGTQLWPMHAVAGAMTSSVWRDGRAMQTMVNGVPTLAGWMDYGRQVLQAGWYGALSGYIFWLVWNRAARPAANEPATSTGDSHD